ncbi:MAG: lamin tail domain-containing protein [Ignavibacteria bacterium]|nr:lamin tail domain-containing protein [Ignavibacteria bacterium]
MFKRHLLYIFAFFIFTQPVFSQVVINEIMYAPLDATNEWFEIYNNSDNPVSLRNWKWKDATATVRTITTQNLILPGRSFLILCQDSVKLKTLYNTLNLSGKFIQTPWSALNNTGGDNVILFDSTNTRIDSVNYSTSWGGSNNFSLERINPSGLSNQQSNWGSSVNILKATPSFQNSLTPLNYDVALTKFEITPANPQVGDSLKFNFTFKNRGLNVANNILLEIFIDLNFDSVGYIDELIGTFTVNSLNSGDSVNYTYTRYASDSGAKQFIGKISYPQEEDSTNNKLVRRINIGGFISSTGLKINEIMYAPVSPEKEWFELINTTTETVNLANWKWKDATSTVRTITNQNIFVKPNSYVVICEDSVSVRQVHPQISGIIIQTFWNALNNSGDDLIIYNPNGLTEDSVNYKSSWGGSSKFSLERINPDGLSNDSTNWASSIACAFSTPDAENSVRTITSYAKGDVVINEIMYDPLTGNAEWIELYNPKNFGIKLTGWKFNESNSFINVSDTCEFIFTPGSYLVISSDSTIFNRFPDLRNLSANQKLVFSSSSFSLSNDGEPLKIYDAKNNLIDSVYYKSNWQNPNLASTKGFSLERINPLFSSNDASNWSSSTDILGGTPCKKNSIYLDVPNANTTITISPNPFSPDGDGYEDNTIISYKLKSRFAQVRVKIFDSKGRLVKTLLNNQTSGSEGNIIYNGLGEDGQRLRIGIYIVFIEAIDDTGGVIETAKATFVVAVKL